ncbi:hypothetical protein ATANTOWER_019503 [Ataeniobius toweri]|uniref:Uncharacterized protein n=1 Tax=Ataeniobius toweri TaxID=208326 RepID=A0ABU7A959_9TELE|nr:hypothetical protein [Ataeniobius toweri]
MPFQPLRMTLSSLYGPHVLVCMLTTSEHAHYTMTYSVLGYLLPDPNQGITELIDNATWWRHIDLNMMSHRCSIGLRSGERGGQSVVSIPSSSRNYLPASCHMRPDIMMHQEEPRTHCHCKGSKDLFLIPNGSQGSIIYSVQVSASLHGMPPNRSCCPSNKTQTSQVLYQTDRLSSPVASII